MSSTDRERYAQLFGPTAEDRIRLADTELFIEIEQDLSRGPDGIATGDEAVFGGGKVIRESMGQSIATRGEGTPDLVTTGAVVLDHRGIVKADVGIRDGRIVALGKAGNPETMAGVDPRLVIGPSTEVMSGNGKILTAGTVDSHVHLISPNQLSPCFPWRSDISSHDRPDVTSLPTGVLLLADGRSPTGGLAHPGGVEEAVRARVVSDEASLLALLAARLEAAGLVAAGIAATACAAADDPIRLELLDIETDARTPSDASRAASRAQGRGLLRLARGGWPHPA